MKTALIRINGNLKIIREEYRTSKEMAEDLRGNGFRVLKIWTGNKTNEEVEEWEFLNRK